MANYISGMSTGFDWASMITQLLEVERQPEKLMESSKQTLSTKYKAWTGVNTKLLSLKTAAQKLSDTDTFNLFTSSSSVTGTSDAVRDFLTYSVGSNASEGSYSIKVDNLAQAQKLGTKSFNSLSDAIGISGDIVINGRTVNIVGTNSLNDIKTKINALNSGSNPVGVTASIFTVGDGEYRLTLTSKATGADGMSITNGSSTDVLGLLGLTDSTTSLGNAITGGAQSSLFTGSTQNIKGLMGLNSAASASVTVAGQAIAIDLATDSLQSIRDKINANVALQAAGVSASVVSETDDGTTGYRLQIDGTQSLTDSGNILQTLGFLKQGVSDVSGLVGSSSNTTDGADITGATLLTAIDGYNTLTAGDKVIIQGTRHGGAAVGATDFTITSISTMQDLLDAVETAYGGEVNAFVNADGAVVVEDSLSGATSLALTLTATKADGVTPLSLDFGTFGASSIRKRQITAGEDAQITLDGSTITRSTNQLTDVITGVTLNLAKADEDAEINLEVTRDNNAIKSKISDFVKAYNDIMTYVNSQFEYKEDDSTSSSSSKSTPTLFGDTSLMTVRSTIKNVILSGVSGLDTALDHLSLIGVTLDKAGQLSIDSDKLDGYLQTNFSDVVSLFTAQGTSSNSNLSYVNSSTATQEGAYEVEVTQVAAQASVTGAGFSGSLTGAATVTITDDSGRTSSISLNNGWNITSIVNAINSEFAQEYQELRVGANSYYSNALHTTAMTSDTKLDSLYDGTGASAGLAAGDVVNFSGTNRSGAAISGSYTITDAAANSVGDILNTIQEEFGSGYTAYIDSQGRIAVRDDTTGDSSLTLSIDAVKNLDLGAIDVDPTGADGSHEGRISMSMVAESSGGQVKISNTDYGDYHFDIAVSGGNLGIVDGTYTGADIAGRIRKAGSSSWMTMTGTGTALTVEDDQDAEGLVVKYTGTGAGTFDFTFTTGVGEKMDRALYHMTDSVEGFISDKKETLQSQMDSFDLKIEALEKRVLKRQERLVAQFSLMEKLVNQLKAQQSQLDSQLSSLGS